MADLEKNLNLRSPSNTASIDSESTLAALTPVHFPSRPDDGDEEKIEPVQEPQPSSQYSAFSTRQKQAIVLTGSLASFFSPLSSSIYFPALNTISADLKVSDSQINLTVTTFLIMQGIAPMLIAGFSDKVGRRPAYILCFTIYSLANLGLALQDSYSSLLGLRVLQSAGSSSTVAIANGLVADMITSSERGKYVAWASIGSLLGPSVAPIIGGLIADNLDWHWIFWFLLILSVAFFVPLFLFLPETCRNVVGDGSVPPPWPSWSLTDTIRHHKRYTSPEVIADTRKNYEFQFPNPWPTILVVFDLASFLILLAAGMSMASYYAIATGLSTSFNQVYGFSDIQIALMFIPIGAGGALSVFTTGQMVDWNFKRWCRKMNVTVIKGVKQDLSEFPIERARLELLLPLYAISSILIIVYGWIIGIKVNLAGPIILLFVIGWAFTAAMQVLNAIMVDLWPGKSASATAANNLFRCGLGAGASAAIQPMINAMGKGWSYTVLALLSLACLPALILLMKSGLKWRRQKRLREDSSGR